jgi:hypothetical protein
MKAVSIRLSDEQHEVLQAEAITAHRSLAAHIMWLLDEAQRLKGMIDSIPKYTQLDTIPATEEEEG